MSITKIIIASTNIHKRQELEKFLEGLPIQVESCHAEVTEDGTTFDENALKKLTPFPPQANTIYLADDSGLEVTSLNHRPGIHSARYAGPHATSIQQCETLLTELAPLTDRSAQFVCVIALKFPDGHTETFRGIVKGHIAPRIQGPHGFGYDPIFIPEGYTQTYGELPAQLKAQTSHRAQALFKVKERLHP